MGAGYYDASGQTEGTKSHPLTLRMPVKIGPKCIARKHARNLSLFLLSTVLNVFVRLPEDYATPKRNTFIIFFPTNLRSFHRLFSVELQRRLISLNEKQQPLFPFRSDQERESQGYCSSDKRLARSRQRLIQDSTLLLTAIPAPYTA